MVDVAATERIGQQLRRRVYMGRILISRVRERRRVLLYFKAAIQIINVCRNAAV
jgi:hypothetical protein